jgi:hypothetical protein
MRRIIMQNLQVLASQLSFFGAPVVRSVSPLLDSLTYKDAFAVDNLDEKIAPYQHIFDDTHLQEFLVQFPEKTISELVFQQIMSLCKNEDDWRKKIASVFCFLRAFYAFGAKEVSSIALALLCEYREQLGCFTDKGMEEMRQAIIELPPGSITDLVLIKIIQLYEMEEKFSSIVESFQVPTEVSYLEEEFDNESAHANQISKQEKEKKIIAFLRALNIFQEVSLTSDNLQVFCEYAIILGSLKVEKAVSKAQLSGIDPSITFRNMLTKTNYNLSIPVVVDYYNQVFLELRLNSFPLMDQLKRDLCAKRSILSSSAILVELDKLKSLKEQLPVMVLQSVFVKINEIFLELNIPFISTRKNIIKNITNFLSAINCFEGFVLNKDDVHLLYNKREIFSTKHIRAVVSNLLAEYKMPELWNALRLLLNENKIIHKQDFEQFSLACSWFQRFISADKHMFDLIRLARYAFNRVLVNADADKNFLENMKVYINSFDVVEIELIKKILIDGRGADITAVVTQLATDRGERDKLFPDELPSNSVRP